MLGITLEANVGYMLSYMTEYNREARERGMFGYFEYQYAMPLFYKRNILHTSDEALEAMTAPYHGLDSGNTIIRWVLGGIGLIFVGLIIFLSYKIIKKRRKYKRKTGADSDRVTIIRHIGTRDEHNLSDS